MKLIIDIPEEDYNFIKSLYIYTSGRRSAKLIEHHIINGIRTGIPYTGIPYEERPQGEWNEIQAGMFVCPFCGARPHKDFKNFCANCGAKMKGGAE